MPQASAASAAHVAFTIRDPRITEASGLAFGVVSPGVAYVQNDSGDTNRFFALNAQTGETAATITVPGARNVDWEDLAVAPSAAGVPSVWLADIGDNFAARDEVDVYRAPEPRVQPGGRDVSITTAPASVWRLRYPDGPVNAESFAVTPAGVGYIVTKSATGDSVVYRLPPRPDRNAVQPLIRVAQVRFAGSISFGRLATGGAISADGRWLTIRTYLTAYLWRLHGGDVPGALAGTRREISLPLQLQGEGIAFHDGRLYVDSEGRHSPVYSVPAPGTRPRRTRPPTPGATAPTRRTPVPPAESDTTGAARHTGWLVAGSVAAASLAAFGAAAAYRRRRRPSR